jgi:D-aminoacyl-tRNA deacylase
MRAVVQRVSGATVTIDGAGHAEIGIGLLVLLGVETGDAPADLEWLCGKIARLRIFPNETGVMDLDVSQVGGELMVISQFTLLANTEKGNRPSYINAARPEEAVPLYEQACTRLSELCGTQVRTGIFGADMKVALVNDGPVTIILDSRRKQMNT